MGITQGKNVVVITIITACALGTALWLAGVTSHGALSRFKDKSASAAEAPNLSTLAAADKPARLRAHEEYGKLPLSFEVNQGQTDAQVKFLSRGAGYSLFLTPTEAVVSLHGKSSARLTRGRRHKESMRATDVLRMRLLKANPAPKIEGSDQLPGKSNYLIGNNPRNWRINVSTFARVHYREVYPGVDVVYCGNQRNLENDFIVAPGVDPGVIALAFEGAKTISIDNAGSLVLSLEGGDVELQKPVIYQLIDGVRREIAGNYVMRRQREVGFEVAAYDLTKPLVIDPVLIYSFPVAGNLSDSGNAIAVDASGNAYITGDTTSSVFPTASPFDSTLGGGRDAFVAKINAAGTALVYSTYLGGSNVDYGFDLAIDGAGNAYITGRTSSNDFPAVNAFDSTHSGGSNEDAYVARLNAAGSALVYSTYLSGTFGARGWGIATDGVGNAYVTGTTSAGFPVTAATAFDSTAFNTGFMSKLNTNGSGASSLLYSTFLGHTGVGEGRAIAADATGNVYVTGNLSSTATGFASAGAFQTTFGGGFQDAFVEKFNTNLSGDSSRVYSTYLGGSGQDFGGGSGAFDPGKAIAIDASGNAYITGKTTSTNFPTANAFQGANGGNTDAFLSKLNATGSALIYSTYLGGSGSSSDEGRGVVVNVVGNAYVTGLTNSADFPTTSTPPPLSTTGGIFVTKFTASGTAPLAYSTRLVSNSGDKGFGIALDAAGNAFVTGSTGSDVFLNEIADPTIIGRVVDEDGNPISSATVNLDGVPAATTTSDANGYFTFGLLTVANNYTVSVSVPNYLFNSQVVNNLQKNARLDFVGVSLTPTPTPTPTPTATPTPTPSATPMTVQFSASTATATETVNATTKVDLTVTRAGNTSAAASVNYASADGTANERSDYLVRLGTLRFAAGETSKTITVFIVDDSFGEPAETFTVTLSNPVDCMLGTPAILTVTINSNEAINGANPVSDASFSSDFFVRQHYVDFFNREADSAGLAFWKNQIDECTTQACREIRRINVSAAFYVSIEFQQTGYLVYKAYQASFNSGEQLDLRSFLPDTQEIGRGVAIGQPGADAQLETNKQNFFLDFVQRPGFLAAGAYPTTLTAAQFVDKLNGNTLNPLNPGAGPALTQSQRDTLVAQLSTDPTSSSLRAQVLRSVSENGVFSQRQFNKAFVLMQYFGYLRRNPNSAPDTNFDGYNFWLGKLNQFNGNFVAAEMVKAFITSGEYIQRFGPTASTPPTAGAFKLLPSRLGLAIDDDGKLLALHSPGAITWSSSDPAVVTVDTLGQLKALSKGSAIITATSGTEVAMSTLTVYRIEGSNPDPSTDALIAAALAQNRISAEQALIYRVFALFGDERLPSEFYGAPSAGPNHLLLRELATTIASLSSPTQNVLRPFLVPPIYAESWYAQRLGLAEGSEASADLHADGTPKSPLASSVNCDASRLRDRYTRVSTTHFNIFYVKLGDPVYDGQSAAAVALIASLVEEVYNADTGLLQRLPVADTNEACNGGDGRYDLYYGPFALFGVGAWTKTYPLAPQLAGQNACANRPSFTMLNKISLEFTVAERSPEDARLMVKSILAHELMHALQFGMDRQASCTDTEWFDEGTAQWVMDYVVPSIPAGLPGEFGMEPGLIKVSSNYKKSGSLLADYLYSGHKVSIEKAGAQPKFNGYSDYLFFQFLARKQTPNKIKQIFDAMAGGQNSVEAVAAAVDMKTIWPEFARTLWIGSDEQVLDYWATEDEYGFGLAKVYAQVPTTDVPQELKDRLKSLKIEQEGAREAEFELLKNALEFESGDYKIDPRSMFYEHLKFTDATVHYVTFFNPIADAANNDFMKVQAVKKIDGIWSAPEDWTADAFKTFCLDKKDERLQELLIIVSNSETNRSSEMPFTIPGDTPMLVRTSNVGCWRWEGTASLTTNTVDGPVTVESAVGVTFDRFRLPGSDPAGLVGLDTFGSSNAGIASYSITGTLTGSGCTISGMASAALQGDGELLADGGIIVHYLFPGTVLHRMAIGAGVTNIPSVAVTITCPNRPPETSTSFKNVHWLSLPQEGVPVSADGQTIMGRWERTDSEGAKTSVWNFRAVREQ